jgi:hypothetical protein
MQRLTPRDIYSLRHERLALSRKNFAALSGIGEASLARWESGELIQSESNDNLLRLLASDDNVQALRELRRTAKSVVPARPTNRASIVVTSESRTLAFARCSAIEDADHDRVIMGRDRFQLRRTG